MISMLYMWTHWSLCDSFWKLSNDTGMMLGKKIFYRWCRHVICLLVKLVY